MLKIENFYKDEHGKVYNIRNINCDEISDLDKILGKIIDNSKEENKSIDIYGLDDGTYLNQSKLDDKKALKIYKNFNMYKYTNYNDHILVDKLQQKQDSVKLTEFPTGIITIENKIIGQEIPYYDNHKTIKAEIEEIKDIKKLLLYYKQIIDIIEELLKNNIYYADLNTGNFLVKNDIIKLIDFELGFINFDGNYKYIINNLINLLKSLKKNLTIDFNFSNNSTIEEIREEINLKTKRLM